MKTLYTTHVTAVGGRNGKISSQDGILNLEVRAPKEMGGSGGATNPEQLFAAGYAACFDGALNLVARQAGTPLKNTEISSEVRLLFSEQEGFGLEVDLFVRIPDTDPALARELMEKAHHTCPYSKAIEGNVKVQLHLLEK